MQNAPALSTALNSLSLAPLESPNRAAPGGDWRLFVTRVHVSYRALASIRSGPTWPNGIPISSFPSEGFAKPNPSSASDSGEKTRTRISGFLWLAHQKADGGNPAARTSEWAIRFTGDWASELWAALGTRSLRSHFSLDTGHKTAEPTSHSKAPPRCWIHLACSRAVRSIAV